jgi:hypothetical protein
MTSSYRHLTIGMLLAGAAALVSGVGFADTPSAQSVLAGRSTVYKDLDPGSLEDVSTPDHIMAVTGGNVSPTEIWATLEHGERVECVECVPAVGKLLYADSTVTREISAWWLRRRIFGVFGPGQVYEQTIQTVGDQSQSELKRAYAAQALGEFLAEAGAAPLAKAATADPSPLVRKAAVAALERLDNQGPNGEIATAMSDPDEGVRMAALHAAIRVNVFTHVDAVAALIGDKSPLVRRRVAQDLGVMRDADAVASLVVLASPDTEPDASVRKAAVYALGQIGDAGGAAAVQAAMQDPDQFVRDAAKIASRRL